MNSGILLQLKKSLKLPEGAFDAGPISVFPKSIVSLVPSQTELLHYLGLDEEVSGITKFCIHPNSWFRNKTRVGGTKSPDIGQIKLLKPDLVIANKEENRKEDIEALAEHFPVYVSDVETLDDALQMISELGQITGTSERATELLTAIRNNFDLLKHIDQPVTAAYLIWQNPYMAAGSNTFINDMMQRCGLKNIFADAGRYPEVNMEQLQHCSLLLLSSEPFPFKDDHVTALQAQLPDTKVMLVDGEMFSWYGSRLLMAPGYFGKLFGFL